MRGLRDVVLSDMEIILVLLGLALILSGPLAYFSGKDSRRVADRGWFGRHAPN
jgi:hypothetical protein